MKGQALSATRLLINVHKYQRPLFSNLVPEQNGVPKQINLLHTNTHYIHFSSTVLLVFAQLCFLGIYLRCVIAVITAFVLNITI